MKDKNTEKPIIIESSAEKQPPVSGRYLRTVIRLAACLVFTVVLIFVGILIYTNAYDIDSKELFGNIFSGKWNDAGEMLNISDDLSSGSSIRFAKIIEPDDGDVFYVCDGTLYRVNNDFICRYGKHGEEEYQYSLSMENAAVSGNGNNLLVYDIGGSMLVKIVDGEFDTWTVDGTIINAYINANGYTAVTLAREGYRSVVELYNTANTCIVQRYINYDYAIWAGISRSNKKYVINRVNMDEIKIITWIEHNDTESTAPTASVSKFDALAVKGEFCADDTYIAIADNSVTYYGKNGNTVFEQNIETIYDIGVSAKNDVAISVKTGDGTLLGKNMIYIFRGEGTAVTEIGTALPGKSVSIYGDRVCINTGTYVYVYDLDGLLLHSYKAEDASVKDAVMIDGNEYLIILQEEILKIKI